MSKTAATVFTTAIGPCGLAWSDGQVIGVQLPETDRAATETRLAERFPAARLLARPAPAMRPLVSDLTALLRGEARDLRGVALALEPLPDFARRVYAAAREIAPGRTTTYGELARTIAQPGAARAVGQALGRNPFPLIVPCHRVLAANGRLGGFTANGGILTKERILAIEGGTPASAGSPHNQIFDFPIETALAALRRADPHVAAALVELGPFRMELTPTPSVFAALVQSIVYQQLHGKAAASIHARLCALFPRSGKVPTAARLMKLDDATLRGVGLSQNKLLAMRDLAQRCLAGTVPTMEECVTMTNEDIIERLTAVRGIGRWTVEMLMMFKLGRPDILPVDDFGVRAGFAAVTGRREQPTPRELAAYGARWAPYRTLVSWYLWRAADRAKGG